MGSVAGLMMTTYDIIIGAKVENVTAENLDGNALEGARIGILTELAYPIEGSGERAEENIDDQVADAFDHAVKELEDCGATVIRVSIPNIFVLDEASKENDAQGAMGRLYGEFESLVEEERLDAVIFPSYLTAPLKSGVDESGQYWDVEEQVFINNTAVFSPSAGLPEISVPIGNHSNGAGIGMEIAALKGEEQRLLDMAYSYMKEYDHRALPEGAPDLYGGKAHMSVEELIDRNAVAVGAVGSIAGASPYETPAGWIHTRNVLLICGISAAAVLIISRMLIMTGKRTKKKEKKTKDERREEGRLRRMRMEKHMRKRRRPMRNRRGI